MTKGQHVPQIYQLRQLARQLLVQLVVRGFRLQHLVSLVSDVLLLQRLHDLLELGRVEERRPDSWFVAGVTAIVAAVVALVDTLLARSAQDGGYRAWTGDELGGASGLSLRRWVCAVHVASVRRPPVSTEAEESGCGSVSVEDSRTTGS